MVRYTVDIINSNRYSYLYSHHTWSEPAFSAPNKLTFNCMQQMAKENAVFKHYKSVTN